MTCFADCLVEASLLITACAVLCVPCITASTRSKTWRRSCALRARPSSWRRPLLCTDGAPSCVLGGDTSQAASPTMVPPVAGDQGCGGAHHPLPRQGTQGGHQARHRGPARRGRGSDEAEPGDGAYPLQPPGWHPDIACMCDPKVLRPALQQMELYLQPWRHLVQTMIEPIHANIEAARCDVQLLCIECAHCNADVGRRPPSDCMRT